MFFIFLVRFCIVSANFWWNFVRISRQFPEKSDVCRFFNQICENKLENCRKFWNLWKLFNIIQYDSFVSLVFGRRTFGCARRRSRETSSGRTCRSRWPRFRAKYYTPEINTSEIIVDFQWHFPMDCQWHFPTSFHVSVVFSKDCHLSSGCLLVVSNRYFSGIVLYMFMFVRSGV